MTANRLPPPVWVSRPEALNRLADELARQPRIAVDTESNSLYAYREQVCLIQFSTPETDYLVDPLALADLSPLGPVFADPGIEKVFHAVEYDLICLQRDFGFNLSNLFDTMQAARILGYSSVGLDSLLTANFGISLNKRWQRADWGRRPLPDEMRDYARLDTHYLIRLRDILADELVEKGRWELAREDFSLACQLPNGNGRSDCPAWEKMSGGQGLSPRELTILNELCEAREKIAERLDRPVFKVIGDQALLRLATVQPRSEPDLGVAGLTSKQVRFFGAELLAAVRRGDEAPLVKRTPNHRPSDAFLARIDLLKNWRKRTAQKLGVESDVILPRRFMHELAEKCPEDIRGLAEVMAGSPWRVETYGGQIIKLLNGHS
ncbi:MAG: ribonuclease D [Chloroflexota bacterium]